MLVRSKTMAKTKAKSGLRTTNKVLGKIGRAHV